MGAVKATGPNPRSFSHIRTDRRHSRRLTQLHTDSMVPLPITAVARGAADDLIVHARGMRGLIDSISSRAQRSALEDGDVAPGATFNAVVVWDSILKNYRWEFCQSTLLDGLYLQLGEAITRGAQIGQCAHCGDWFEAGAGDRSPSWGQVLLRQSQNCLSQLKAKQGEISMRPTGHIRERSPGSWELRYSLGTDPATGKRRMATTTVKGNRRDAEKELRRLLRTLDTGEHVDPTRMTVREWLKAWVGAIREEVSPKSHERYSEIVDNFLVPELGALPIGKADAGPYLDSLHAMGDRRPARRQARRLVAANPSPYPPHPESRPWSCRRATGDCPQSR